MCLLLQKYPGVRSVLECTVLYYEYLIKSDPSYITQCFQCAVHNDAMFTMNRNRTCPVTLKYLKSTDLKGNAPHIFAAVVLEQGNL